MKLPDRIADDLDRAVRLERWTLAWLASIIVVIGLTMGSSQAMRTAWVEDVLGLVPAIVFLLAARYERRPPTRRFPYGFTRVNSLSFLVAATALTAVGGYLIVDATLKLVQAEHPTIGPVHIFGEQVWLGWLMVAALAYSVVPPFILGRMKLPLARRLQDKVLHTDALMLKAEWMTGLAGAAGVLGVGFGLWWADAVAAATISLAILKDGVTALRVATAELVDGTPRELGGSGIAEDARVLENSLVSRFPGCDVRLRETGRYIAAQIVGDEPPRTLETSQLWPGEAEREWRLAEVSFASRSQPDTGSETRSTGMPSAAPSSAAPAEGMPDPRTDDAQVS